ncbi:Major facilitator superfamily domain-containing protein 6-B [Eumeta japonica]|uniref:Major facilitator superfamily domain-containing protein 6-B n=1 Tax=Eumeta variegata TaxID=151549 RepID=A0A4C1Z7X3_EUMVA|nr:Major facilitator superfamily domain-containing protein 6-B [Eumeta japonica]
MASIYPSCENRDRTTATVALRIPSSVRIKGDGKSSAQAWEQDGRKGNSACLFESGANDASGSITTKMTVGGYASTVGTAWGYIESFLFWLLQDLGASRSLMGITITVGGVAGLPLLVLSGPIISRLGHANVIFIGFVFYAIRLLGYSLIYNPWLCLIFEALESVTSSLSFTAAVTYAARLSSTTTDTSVQGLLGGIYYGVGKGSGSLIGGYLMKQVGTRTTYQIFATATLVTGCIYYLFNRFYLRKRIAMREDDICTKKPAILDVECRQVSDKENEITDGAIKKIDNVEVDNASKTADEKRDSSKTTKDNTDGGSDSGVDNPAYNETETLNGKPRK